MINNRYYRKGMGGYSARRVICGIH